VHDTHVNGDTDDDPNMKIPIKNFMIAPRAEA
jgi:hypothetical protein